MSDHIAQWLRDLHLPAQWEEAYPYLLFSPHREPMLHAPCLDGTKTRDTMHVHWYGNPPDPTPFPEKASDAS